jgi:hypothetical protein
LISKALGGPAAGAIEVINTCSWPRTGLVILKNHPFSQSSNPPILQSTNPPIIQSSDSSFSAYRRIRMTGSLSPLLLSSSGDTIQTQLLSSGEVVFVARDVPGLGSAVYRFAVPGSRFAVPSSQSAVGSQTNNNIAIEQYNNRTIEQYNNIETKNFSLEIDEKTGAIGSLKWQGKELVDTSRFAGINQYLYVEGRFPDSPLPAEVKKISIIDDGPVITTIRIEMEAPGCNTIAADAQIIDELNIIRVINHIDKKKVYDPEAVHIAFPFNIPDGKIRYDLAYGWCEPEKDQLPGSNKNFLVMEHWVDISNAEHGLTLICTDAPLFEVGEITMDAIVTGWRDSIAPSQTVLSYLMNNYWETNYAATQDGPGIYSYILSPHGGFDAAAAERAAIEQRQPLIGRIVGDWQGEMTSPININNSNNFNNNSIIITSIRSVNEGKDLMITLYNAGDKTEILDMEHDFREVYPTDLDGISRRPALEDYRIPPHGTMTLLFLR